MKRRITWKRGLVLLLVAGFIFGTGALWGTATGTTEKGPAKIAAGKAGEVALVPAQFTDLAAKAKPGVVNIRTVKTMKGGSRLFRHFFGSPFGDMDPFREFFGPEEAPRDFKQNSLGSGFLIDREGYIVTNNHVIEDADEIKVKLSNDKEFDATVVGRDAKTDIALIRIKGAADLAPLVFGDSNALPIGSWVVAIGSPFGLEQTVTAGIVSAKGRVIGAGPYDDFIQTDASINPGNSGGPLLNMKGEVVGINTAIAARGQGIGFAIPSNMAKEVIAQLKSGGTVTRGWMGVAIQDLTPELQEYYGLKDRKGVFVGDVFKDDPADKAGIKPQDVIVAIDGKAVSSSRDLSRLIAGVPVGKTVEITLLRDGAEKTVKVEIAKRSEGEAASPGDKESPGELGLAFADLTPELAKRLGLGEREKGVVVTGVQPGSKAAQAGFQPGDVVREINRAAVRTGKDLRARIDKAKKGERLQFLLKRGNAGMVVIQLTK